MNLSETLRRQSKTLGLPTPSQFQQFGTTVNRLLGNFRQTGVEIEAYRDGDGAFARFVFTLPRHPLRGIRILTDAASTFRYWGSQLQGVPLDGTELTDQFVAVARNRKKFFAFLSEGLQFQLNRLAELTETLKLTDRQLFLYVEQLTNEANIERILKKGLETVDRAVRTARIFETDPNPDSLTPETRDIKGLN